MLSQITSKQNRQYKYFVKISKRQLADFCLLEGERLVAELLGGAYRENVAFLLFDETYARTKTDKLQAYSALLPATANVYVLPDELLLNLLSTVNSQGIAAIMLVPQADEPYVFATDGMERTYTEAAFNNKNLLVVLDCLQDPGNLGNIIRSANAFGVEAIYSIKGTVHAWQSKVIRSAMGGMFKLKIHENMEAATLYRELLAARYQLLAADIRGENLFTYVKSSNFQNSDKIALVIGNEGNGLSDVTRGFVEKFIKIPMTPYSESLNAAAACTTALALLRCTGH